MSNIRETVQLFNRTRRANPGQWFTLDTTVKGHRLRLKAYGTWIQVARYRGIEDGGPMDCQVRDVTQWLIQFLESVDLVMSSKTDVKLLSDVTILEDSNV